MNRSLLVGAVSCLLLVTGPGSKSSASESAVSSQSGPVFVVASEVATQGNRELAEAKNELGMIHYKKGRFERAVAEFESAVRADPSYHWGHYNLACTLGILRSKGSACAHDAYASRITGHLKIFIQLKPELREKMRKDSDLTSVRDTFVFQTLIGLSVTDTDDVTQILQRVSWYRPGTGLWGPEGGADFKSGGVVKFWDIADFQTGERSASTGRYRVEGNKVFLEWKGTGGSQGRRSTGTLAPDGRLILDDGSILTDDPDDCSA